MTDTATLERPAAAGQAAHATPLLEIRGIRKGFPGVLALDNVGFTLKAGTVHALMGENGAGKSTLMKIIAGVYTPDKGEIRLKGQPVTLKSPIDALSQGIAMIHQELNLMPHMTVAENVWITREPKNRLGFVDHAELKRRTEDLFARLNIRIDPLAEIQTLSVASRQMVEIAKAVSWNSDVLIMDEPTSALTEKEVEHLFTIIRTLREQGKGIIYITHKMNELFEIADEFSVFRDGQYIATCASSEVTRDDIIRMMVGREITQMFPKETVPIGDVVLSVKNLSLDGVFQDVSFDIRAGEILGLAGLVGSGRSNVAETLFGVTPATSGSITIKGEQVRIDNPAQAMRHGMAFLTEDRKDTGCFLCLDIQTNAEMAVLNQRYVNKLGFVESAQLTRDAITMAKRLRVKTPDMQEIIQNLSGGNQQKVLVARWLLTNPKILILDEPTRGIDVGAKAEIHRLVSELAGQGVAILMISSEMPEVLGMSDRIAVMHQGRITGILDRSEATQVSVMDLAAK
ncbi:sugar ABC transporter ATP-binding protein [Hydrogenophaga pseudoflava]|uniref:sugar ABC transporter ATP-binding protein n=1 Tax=Hydrogenophaga pseudoflava TaxID=47421 RepID=UPI0027E57EA0|nr:sugar ABC transporter ATP-binding protein [Hydrogenophaga pseudoflava]MDQ7743839.1 sugar ABC transporter ATP-binding protein [Hydrogenophaga pseudoflava]